MGKSKKYIILTILIVLVLISSAIIFFLASSKNYSVVDINADNYEKKLLRVDDCIEEAGIDKTECIPDNIRLIESYNYREYKDCDEIGMQIKRDSFENKLKLNIYSCVTGVQYDILFKENRATMIFLLLGSFSDKLLIKKIVDNLILKEGFVLKKSDLIKGCDILIKETQNNFIICTIPGKYENIYDRPMFNIMPYSKKKY